MRTTLPNLADLSHFLSVQIQSISFYKLRQVPSPGGERDSNIGRDVDVGKVIRERSATEGP